MTYQAQPLFTAKPFIIAEVGSNFTNFTEAKDSVAFASTCGADAVKFQAFDHEALYGMPGNMQGLPLDWLPKLKEKADACGIALMCSAFSPELYDAVDPYVSVHKIASSEVCNPVLLRKVASLGKPIIMSVGASSTMDVAQALSILMEACNGQSPPLVLMYCSAAYPSTQYNLFYMESLKQFACPVGFSDHSTSVFYPALSAVKHFGAVAIEKHVNFARHVGPDAAHSLNHEDFHLMCQMLHGERDHTSFNPMPEEKAMFLRHNRRLIATADIAPGDVLQYGVNYGAFRSLKDDTSALTPLVAQSHVDGKPCKNALKSGDAVGPLDV